MSEYVILLPGEESRWEQATAEDRERVYGVHRAFMEQLAERGHTITGGSQLAHSRETTVLRTDAAGEQTVTQGPYAETAEQLTGFYVVDSDDLDDLVDVCWILGRGDGVIEIRPGVGSAS